MMTVVNVGDGACSVFRPTPYDASPGIAVLDCGAWTTGDRAAAIAAGRLVRVLGADWPLLTTMLVSHWDDDHWRGLRQLGNRLEWQGRLDHLDVYFPAMPRPVVTMMQFINNSGATGLDASDLRHALTPLVRDPGSFRMITRTRGQMIEVAGTPHLVLWPPPVDSQVTRMRVRRAVGMVKALADRLAERGDYGLLNNLERARESDYTNSPGVDSMESFEAPWLGDPLVYPDVTDASEPRNRASPQRPDEVEIPEDLAGEYKQVVKEVRAANNDLSMITMSVDGRVLTLGDAGGRVLAQVAQDIQRLRDLGRIPKNGSPSVMLAPHHGTMPLPMRFPSFDYCIAQAGVRHYRKWRCHPVGTQVPTCISTKEVGTVSFLWP